MINQKRIFGAVILLWGMSAIPGAAAEQVCYTTIEGFWQCTDQLPLGVRIAICIGVSIILTVLLTACFSVSANRRRSREISRQQAIASVYQVDATRIQPTQQSSYVTSFDHRSPAAYPLPRSAYPQLQAHTPDPPSSFPKTPAGYSHTPDTGLYSVDLKHDAYEDQKTPSPSSQNAPPHVRFSATQRYHAKFRTKGPQTAPVNPAFKSPGAYPFPGYSPRPGSTQQPYTAYPGGGFPRPLYTGRPVQKDSEREVRNEIV